MYDKRTYKITVHNICDNHQLLVPIKTVQAVQIGDILYYTVRCSLAIIMTDFIHKSPIGG